MSFIRPLYGTNTAIMRPLYGPYTATLRPLYEISIYLILKRELIVIFFAETLIFRDIMRLIKNFLIYHGKQKISLFFAVSDKFRDIAHTVINTCLCRALTV